MTPSFNGQFPDDRNSLNLIGYGWEEAEDLAAELGVKIARIDAGGTGDFDAPYRVIRQVWRGDVLELTVAPEVWTP